MDSVHNNAAAVTTLYDIDEVTPPHSEVVVMIARGVGVLVGIVAVISSITIMMVLRYFIAVWLNGWGVCGVVLSSVLIVYAISRYNNVPVKLIWTILSRSCS